jgi:type I restriction enzyme S subunit
VRALPSSWANATIGEVTEYLSRGKSPKYTDRSTLPVINQRSIRWFGIQDEHLKYVHESQIPEWTSERYIRDGDILWNSTGTGTIGRACLVRGEDLTPRKVVDSHVTIIRVQPEVVDPRYLFAWIRGPEVQGTIEDLASGSTNQIELNRSTIQAMRVPVAPLNEQRRISNKLDSVLDRVEQCRERLDRVPQILKKFREAVLEAAVSGVLTEEWRTASTDVPSAVDQGSMDPSAVAIDEPFSIPESWRWMRLASVTTNHDNKRVPVRASERAKRRGAYPYYGAFGVIDTIDAFLYDGTYLLVAEDGKNLESRDRPIAVVASGQFWVNNHAHVIREANGANLSYLHHYLNSKALDLQPHLTGIDQVKLTRGALDEIPVPVPPEPEAEEIVRRIDELFALANGLERRFEAAVSRVTRLVPSVLAKAFRGELVPQDPNDESVEEMLERIRAAKNNGSGGSAAANAGKRGRRSGRSRKPGGGRRLRASSA